ncbi:MAG: P-type conjugative transfer ATPase TrbB [Hellea sp.]|nr:P-type conjugative transfer ATPase TrbB [Hellea sp.]
MSLRHPISQTRTLDMLASAFGKQVSDALSNSSVTEIMLNPDGHLWTDCHDLGRSNTGQKISPEDAERIIRLVASFKGEGVDRDRPLVSAELPGGERFEGLLPPITTAPSFSIRKASAKELGLSDYVGDGVLSDEQAKAVRKAVHAKLNILIIGGTGSGKTTLANALLSEIATLNDRILILEDTRELKCAAPDVVALRTSENINMAALVRSSLRLRPDRIIIGEVRGAEALDLLKAWNTGHPGGIATVHANSAMAGLSRMEQLILEAIPTVPPGLITDAIDVLVFISGKGSSRRVETIARLTGFDGLNYQLESMAEACSPSHLKLIKKET